MKLTRRDLLQASAQVGCCALGASLGVLRAHAEPLGEPLPFTIDTHCHIFNARELPIDGFVLAILHGKGVPPVLDGVVGPALGALHQVLAALAKRVEAKTIEDAKVAQEIDKALHHNPATAFLEANLSKNVQDKGKLLRALLTIAVQPPLENARELIRTYPSVGVFLPALVDYEHWVNRNRSGKAQPTELDLREQITRHEDVFRIINLDARRNSRMPDHGYMHGYVPFNPLRWVMHDAGKDDIDPLLEVRRAIGVDPYKSRGFIGVKVYPPTGFAPLGNAHIDEFQADGLGEKLDRAMRALFDLCQAEDIPIISHASDGNAFGPGYERRVSPWGWWRALDEYSNLRLDLAHFGHDHGLGEDGCPSNCVTWSKLIADQLMGRYPNVYADLGYSPLTEDQGYRERYKAYVEKSLALIETTTDDESNGSIVTNRLMYGSDWWMLRQEPHFDGFLDCFRETIEGYDALPQLNGKALVERFFGGNARRFLGIVDAKGNVDENSKTLQRLLTYYRELFNDPRARPGWLSTDPLRRKGIALKGRCG